MTNEQRYDSLFQFWATVYGCDWLLLKAQAKAESNFFPDAVSHVGASGLCQFMPSTFLEWSDRLKIVHANLWNPEHQIRCQAAYMRFLLTRYNGKVEHALAAYNWGLGHVDKYKELAYVEVFHSFPEETVLYVDRILKFKEAFND